MDAKPKLNRTVDYFSLPWKMLSSLHTKTLIEFPRRKNIFGQKIFRDVTHEIGHSEWNQTIFMKTIPSLLSTILWRIFPSISQALFKRKELKSKVVREEEKGEGKSFEVLALNYLGTVDNVSSIMYFRGKCLLKAINKAVIMARVKCKMG